MRFVIDAHPVEDSQFPDGFKVVSRWEAGTLCIAYRDSVPPLEVVGLIAAELARVARG